MLEWVCLVLLLTPESSGSFFFIYSTLLRGEALKSRLNWDRPIPINRLALKVANSIFWLKF